MNNQYSNYSNPQYPPNLYYQYPQSLYTNMQTHQMPQSPQQQPIQNPIINKPKGNDQQLMKIVKFIENLRNPDKREDALHQLSKKRQTYPNLAPILWHSVGTIAILLQEIVQIYPDLAPPRLSTNGSNRVCLVLGLLQCLALHHNTRHQFLNAHIPLFLYPFLNTSIKSKIFQNLRVTSLGVIGALVKGDDSNAINFLMQTQIIPLCLRIMKRGNELSKTVATFIVQKILIDQNGLTYICQTAQRFFAVSTVLNTMIEQLVSSGKQDARLVKHIMRCYLRLSENKKACEALRKCIPDTLKNPPTTLFTQETVRKWHINLMKNLESAQNKIQ